MEEHPEEKATIQKLTLGRTREELEKAYKAYLKIGPPSSDETVSMREIMVEEKEDQN
jgi:hypothetical protein